MCLFVQYKCPNNAVFTLAVCFTVLDVELARPCPNDVDELVSILLWHGDDTHSQTMLLVSCLLPLYLCTHIHIMVTECSSI